MTTLFSFPYPPSVNGYWGFQGHRRFLTAKAVAFKAEVAKEAQGRFYGQSRVSLNISLHAPDKRIRDIDNVLKPLLDAMTQAGIFDDDSQVDVLHVERKEPIKNGLALVELVVLR